MFWIAGWFNYTARWLYRSSAVFFTLFYGLCFIISAANIPYFDYFFKPINLFINALVIGNQEDIKDDRTYPKVKEE